VAVFGSSLASLASPTSDVDLCLLLPLLARDTAEKHKALDAAKV
jgi:DNA polymerase sigma